MWWKISSIDSFCMDLYIKKTAIDMKTLDFYFDGHGFTYWIEIDFDIIWQSNIFDFICAAALTWVDLTLIIVLGFSEMHIKKKITGKKK